MSGNPLMYGGGGGAPMMFEYRNIDYITTAVEDPVVINTWYTVMPTTEDVKLWYVVFEQTNNGATAETVECEFTINGGAPVVAAGAGLDSGNQYYAMVDLAAVGSVSGDVYQVSSGETDQSAPLETRSLQIRVRQTSAVDLVSAQIECNIVYATLEVT